MTFAGPAITPTETADVGAEMIVLGAVMISGQALDDVIELIVPDDFYRPTNGKIFRTLCEKSAQNEPLDLQSVAATLMGDAGFHAAGGAVYLADMMEMVVVPATASYYARIVYEKAVRRRLVEGSMTIAQLARDPGSSIDRVVSRSLDVIEGAERHDDAKVSHVGDIIDDAINSLSEPIDEDKVSHLGIRDVDAVIGPILPGHLIVIAGRPGMGKSVGLLQAARQNAFKLNKAVLTISLEMNRNEWVLRTISAQSGVPASRMQNRTMTEEDWGHIKAASDLMRNAAHGIVDSPAVTLNEIIGIARNWKRKVGRLDQLQIDYLQLVECDPRLQRQEQIAALSRGLKLAGKVLDCGVIVAAQLNRGPEGRTDKRPMLSDLRESGAVEQDADVVILLYRPDYYDPDERPNEIDFIIAKHRDGPTATVTCHSQLHISRFSSFSK